MQPNMLPLRLGLVQVVDRRRLAVALHPLDAETPVQKPRYLKEPVDLFLGAHELLLLTFRREADMPLPSGSFCKRDEPVSGFFVQQKPVLLLEALVVHGHWHSSDASEPKEVLVDGLVPRKSCIYL